MMTESAQLLDAFDARAQRRDQRRDFFKLAIGAAAVGNVAFLWRLCKSELECDKRNGRPGVREPFSGTVSII